MQLLSSAEVEHVSEEKDLGVLIDEDIYLLRSTYQLRLEKQIKLWVSSGKALHYWMKNPLSSCTPQSDRT